MNGKTLKVGSNAAVPVDQRSDTFGDSDTKAENDQSHTHTKDEVSDDDYNNLS